MTSLFMKSCTVETGISNYHKLIMSTCRMIFAKGKSKKFLLSVIRQKGESQNGCFKKGKHTRISENKHFLPPDSKKCLFPGGKKCLFFGNFGVLCFLETPVLRFTLLPYYRRFIAVIRILIVNFFRRL